MSTTPAEPEARPEILGAVISPEENVASARDPGSKDDDAPFWPDETAEVAFLSEEKARGGGIPAPARKSGVVEDGEPRGSLPALDDLVKRIPAEVRDTLEELFRAKFVGVKKMPRKAWKA